MRTLLCLRSVCLPTLLAALAPLAACGAEVPAKSEAGFVDRMVALMPVFTCLDAANVNDRPVKEKCLKDAGIEEAALNPAPSAIPNPALILLPAILYGAGPGVQYTPEIQQRALDHARCIERGARDVQNDGALSEQFYMSAQVRVTSPCSSLAAIQKAMLHDQKSVALTDLLTFLLGNCVEKLTIDYYARTNSWFPKSLEPCVRYLDGRPPSPGCAGKPEPRPPAPPTR